MAASHSCLFIQFAREPIPGAVKTRMTPHLSPSEACALHSALVLWTADTLAAAGLGPVELAVAGSLEHALFSRCLELGVSTLDRQRGVDLGERMYNALAQGLQRYERVILVGSDCPGIDKGYLRRAVAELDKADVVLGPALDGGYVLIGARRIVRDIFDDVEWGSSVVLATTRQSLQDCGMNWAELLPLADIDRPEDLAVWDSLRAAGDGRRAGLRR